MKPFFITVILLTNITLIFSNEINCIPPINFSIQHNCTLELTNPSSVNTFNCIVGKEIKYLISTDCQGNIINQQENCLKPIKFAEEHRCYLYHLNNSSKNEFECTIITNNPDFIDQVKTDRDILYKIYSLNTDCNANIINYNYREELKSGGISSLLIILLILIIFSSIKG